jgi:enoyl-CoA hydratase/carnithine racemase
MSEPLIIFQKINHAAYITLNHPQSGNIINPQMGNEIEVACCQASDDDDIYIIVVTGAGNRFCIGNELEQVLPRKRKRPSDFVLCNIASIIAGVEKPVIAAINGDAFGQGLEIALACDIRITSADAHLGFPDVASGIIPMDGGTQRLSRIVGKGKALELILTAQTIDAVEAEKIGLVSKVVKLGQLTSEVDSLVNEITTKAPIALRYIKEAVNKGMDMTLEQGLRLEADLYFLLHTTSDRKEGIKSFQEKRKPEFKGK